MFQTCFGQTTSLEHEVPDLCRPHPIWNMMLQTCFGQTPSLEHDVPDLFRPSLLRILLGSQLRRSSVEAGPMSRTAPGDLFLAYGPLLVLLAVLPCRVLLA